MHGCGGMADLSGADAISVAWKQRKRSRSGEKRCGGTKQLAFPRARTRNQRLCKQKGRGAQTRAHACVRQTSVPMRGRSEGGREGGSWANAGNAAVACPGSVLFRWKCGKLPNGLRSGKPLH